MGVFPHRDPPQSWVPTVGASAPRQPQGTGPATGRAYSARDGASKAGAGLPWARTRCYHLGLFVDDSQLDDSATGGSGIAIPNSTAAPHRRLFIFDIDGTLLLSGPVARDAFAAAFEEVTTAPAHHARVSFAGMTDRGIFRALLREAEHRLDEDSFERRFAAFAARFTAKLAEVYPTAQGPRLLDGAQAVVQALAAQPDAALALGTGNIRDTATIKLRRFGLDRFFAAGGFGGDHEERSDVILAAMASARARLGWTGQPAGAWVIGDTLQDVAAARAAGTRVLAVGSGFTPLAHLHDSGADAVLPDLADTARVLQVLTRA